MTHEAAEIAKLAERVEATKGADNALDVLIEVALFTPNATEASIRANSAGTKVIYTDQFGKDATYWADDWTMFDRRAATIEALKARARVILFEKGEQA